MLFTTVFFTFIANPAPISIEYEDIILLFLPLLIGLLCYFSTHTLKIYPEQFKIVLPVVIYLSYLLFSTLIGLMRGIPLLMVLRSMGPYINFFPLLFIGFLPKHIVKPWAMSSILIMIGLLQALYLIYLYFSYSNHATSTLGVLSNRITFIDARTTLPMLLALAILPLAFFLEDKSTRRAQKITRLFSIAMIFLALFASMATLTRSIILSIIFGWLSFIWIYLYQQSRVSRSAVKIAAKKLWIYLLCLSTALIIASNIPKIYILEQGLFARFNDSAASKQNDYSNGRLYDEWIPAIKEWATSDSLSLIFGIGAGKSFTVLNGEERTYTHNLLIYSLVYGGLYGLFSCLWLYYAAFRRLISHALQTQNKMYVGFSALLFSLFFYAQFFAVHKGLAFNAMLFLLVALAMQQPSPSNTIVYNKE
jgi:hypothetical protein